MQPIIRVENLSKQYRIGARQKQYKTLRDAFSNSLRTPLRLFQRNGHAAEETIWALRNVSFEVMPGEVVGIIGRNGAGKSTLLKILARITEPTSGEIHLYGRVGSLLEVGTGFHPELTGRENIYLNGAILGMKRSEINAKFDEIVAFAEIGKFLDTVVKHYSSGMYMRLAFAVAAHLDPEILTVDEVLAVGDASFQRKCLGKMGDIARQGRTVLFISHNLAAVRGLCSRTILLESGRVVNDGDAETVISGYFSQGQTAEGVVIWNPETAPSSEEIRFIKAYVLNHQKEQVGILDLRKGFQIAIEYEVLKPLRDLRIGFFIQNSEGIGMCGSNDPEAWPTHIREPRRYISRCNIPGYSLNAGRYHVYFAADVAPYRHIVTTPYCLSFIIEDLVGHGSMKERCPG